VLSLFFYFPFTPVGSNFFLKLISYSGQHNQCTDSQAVLLAGGLNGNPDDSYDYRLMNHESFSRSLGAINWLNATSGKLIISGDGSHSNHNESELLYNYIQKFTNFKFDIQFDNTSPTTDLSAINLRKILDTDRITLITSQLHMKRAMLVFEKQGFQVCAQFSHNQYVYNLQPVSFLINANSIKKFSSVFHEVIGLSWYWITDRI
jgi:uncharacterized SAM-binding protein YcdF (DUF218 family)